MSGYVFGMPGTATTAPTAAGQDERLRLLGKDIKFDRDFEVTPDRDWALVEGIAAMRQAIYHRLITRPGEYKARPEYGVGVLQYLYEPKSPARIAELQTRIRTNILRDRRIDDVVVTVEDITDGLRVGVDVTVRGQRLRFEPFAFTVDR